MVYSVLVNISLLIVKAKKIIKNINVKLSIFYIFYNLISFNLDGNYSRRTN